MAAGDIGSIIDLDHFQPTDAEYPNIFKVSNGVAGVYYDYYHDPHVRTLTVDSDGVIGYISVANIDIQGKYMANGPSNMHDDLYVFSYITNGDNGHVATAQIYTDGSISTKDKHAIGGVRKFTDVCRVSDNICAVIHQNIDLHLVITTVGVDNDGNFTGYIDSHDCGIDYEFPSIVHFNDNIFVAIYTDYPDTFMHTFSIDTDTGSITSIEKQAVADNKADYKNELIKISDNVIAFAKTNWSRSLVVYTIGINSSGYITGNIQSYPISEHGGCSMNPYITHVSRNAYAVVYALQSLPQKGYVRTITIKPNGTIDGMIDELEYKNNYQHDPTIAQINGNIWAIVGRGNSYNCTMYTLDIDTPSDTIISPPRFTSGLSHRSVH